MKILFVVEHFYPYVGGAEELFLNLTVSLVEAGHEISVVTTKYDSSVKESEVYKGVRISRVNCYNRFLFTAFSLPEIIRLSKNVDFIHTTSYNSAIPAFIAGLICKKKVLITFHEVWDKLWFQLPYTSKALLTFYYLYESFILKLPFAKYIAVSEYTRSSLIKKGIPEHKIVQIYNGLDYTAFENFRFQPPEIFTFCFFGRLGISKGIDLLQEATRRFCDIHPNTHLKLIIPTYPEKLFSQILKKINSMHLDKNTILLHNLSKPNLWQEVSNSSCVVIPSHSEGFCFVAVEAVAMGVPVISSGKGALPEVIGGEYITMKDLSVESLFEAMEKAYFAKWEHKTVRPFHLNESIKAYLKLYKEFQKN